jgi:hypothetical protein
MEMTRDAECRELRGPGFQSGLLPFRRPTRQYDSPDPAPGRKISVFYKHHLCNSLCVSFSTGYQREVNNKTFSPPTKKKK